MITENIPSSGIDHKLVAARAVEGGATVIQLRDKSAPAGELIDIGKEIKSLCQEVGCSFIVNDDLDIALETGADGVHLGQSDMTLKEARHLVPSDIVIGVSATNYREALAAFNEGADYIGVGPIFETTSKDDAEAPIGLTVLGKICNEVDIPVIAIGGITLQNIADVKNSGVEGVAVISAVTRADDMTSATRKLAAAVRLDGPI